MDTEDAIRARRTTKNFTDETIDASVIRELLELATWAPNHNLTQPWRFRLVGPESTEALLAIAPPEKKPKVVRAKTRVIVSYVVAGDPTRRTEDILSVGAAIQNVLLAATARGIDSFWQSPTIAGLAASRNKLGLPADEELVGVLHLGKTSTERTTPARRDIGDVFSELP